LSKIRKKKATMNSKSLKAPVSAVGGKTGNQKENPAREKVKERELLLMAREEGLKSGCGGGAVEFQGEKNGCMRGKKYAIRKGNVGGLKRIDDQCGRGEQLRKKNSLYIFMRRGQRGRRRARRERRGIGRKIVTGRITDWEREIRETAPNGSRLPGLNRSGKYHVG